MKKQVFFLTIILSLFIVKHASAMQQQVATKTTGAIIKHYGKKGFSGLMTGLQRTIEGGIPIGIAALQAKGILEEKKLNEMLLNANEETTNFVQLELQKTNVKCDAVKIYPTLEHIRMPIGILNKSILMPPSTEDEITTALKNNDEIKLNKWRGSLQHESNHIKHNDLLLRPIAAFTLPFITHASYKAIRNIFPIAKKTKPFLLQQFLKIPASVGKLMTTVCAITAIYRYQEQRADNEVSNDLNALRGIRELLNEVEEKNIEDCKYLLKSWNLSPKQHQYFRWGLNFLEPHPLPSKRIEKFDQRIALLEKKENNS